MPRTDLALPLNDICPLASAGHCPAPEPRQGGFDPQEPLEVPSLMPKYISDRESSSSLIQSSIYILVTCLKLQDLENKSENPPKPGPQEIFCTSFSEACSKTTRIAEVFQNLSS